jgi:hypothetical protein
MSAARAPLQLDSWAKQRVHGLLPTHLQGDQDGSRSLQPETTRRPLACQRGNPPKFLKLCGRVLYRQVDIEAYEESCLMTSTSSGVARATPAERPHNALLQPLDRNWRQRVRSLINGVEENQGAISGEQTATDLAGTKSEPSATPAPIHD